MGNKIFPIYKIKTYFTMILQLKVEHCITTEHLHDAHSNGNESNHEKIGEAK